MLVDTNVLSETVRARPNRGVLRWLEVHPTFSVSVITLEELSFGVERARGLQQVALQEWFERLVSEVSPEVVPVDTEVALAAGRLRALREKRGRPVAQVDMLILACALVRGHTLVTRNVADFEGCGVALLDPFE